MARPRTARLQTAYDLGHEHGRTGSRPHNADDVIGSDPDMQQAYDNGLGDGTDSLDAPTPPRSSSRPRPHRASPASGRPAGTAAAATPRTSPRRAPGALARRSALVTQRTRFSHPLHWGSGARGQVIGRPTLRAPSGGGVRDWTGFGFGLFLYALAASYITYGAGGPTMWFRAKFFNRTPGGDAAQPSPHAQTQQQLAGAGIIAPGAKGLTSVPMTGNTAYIQGKDGLFYPVSDASKVTLGP